MTGFALLFSWDDDSFCAGLQCDRGLQIGHGRPAVLQDGEANGQWLPGRDVCRQFVERDDRPATGQRRSRQYKRKAQGQGSGIAES